MFSIGKQLHIICFYDKVRFVGINKMLSTGMGEGVLNKWYMWSKAYRGNSDHEYPNTL